MQIPRTAQILYYYFLLTAGTAGFSASAEGQDLFPRGTDSLLVHHTYYTLSFLPKHMQAEWVAYWLADTMITGSAERSGAFRFDAAVPGGSARSSDYRNSGFDKGHLCPAADMKWNERAMTETFYMSNMSPQSPAFNRGIWKELEELVRSWTAQWKRLFVVTGPVLRDSLPSIGIRNRVSVPELYYKVLYRTKDSSHQAIGFLLPNHGSSDSLSRFTVPIDSIEGLTGIDFFPSFPDSVQAMLEVRSWRCNWFPSSRN